MIGLTEYYKGRDVLHAPELTDEIKLNAAQTVRRVNQLLERFYAANPKAARRTVNSGWRPATVNRKVNNAAPRSGRRCFMP